MQLCQPGIAGVNTSQRLKHAHQSFLDTPLLPPLPKLQPLCCTCLALLFTFKTNNTLLQGDMGSLRLVEEAMPQLNSPGQVLVEVQALGLNLADVFCCLGGRLLRPAPKVTYNMSL